MRQTGLLCLTMMMCITEAVADYKTLDLCPKCFTEPAPNVTVDKKNFNGMKNVTSSCVMARKAIIACRTPLGSSSTHSENLQAIEKALCSKAGPDLDIHDLILSRFYPATSSCADILPVLQLGLEAVEACGTGSLITLKRMIGIAKTCK